MRRTLVSLFVLPLLAAGACSSDPSAQDEDIVVSFSCGADSSGTWIAGGTVRNPSDTPQTYRLTATPGGREDGPSYTLDVGPVAPGQTQDFTFEPMEGPSDLSADEARTCGTEVVTLTR